MSGIAAPSFKLHVSIALKCWPSTSISAPSIFAVIVIEYEAIALASRDLNLFLAKQGCSVNSVTVLCKARHVCGRIADMVMTVEEAGAKRWKGVPSEEHKEISARGGKNFWAGLTPKERSIELKRRARKRKRKTEAVMLGEGLSRGEHEVMIQVLKDMVRSLEAMSPDELAKLGDVLTASGSNGEFDAEITVRFETRKKRRKRRVEAK